MSEALLKVNRECYGVFCCTAYDSLVTPDKQLHIGPVLIRGPMSEHWEGLINTMLWIQEQIPQHTFTIVFDDWEAFDNPYLWDRSNTQNLKPMLRV